MSKKLHEKTMLQQRKDVNANITEKLQELAFMFPRDVGIQYSYYICFGELSQSFLEEIDSEIVNEVAEKEYLESFEKEVEEVLNS